MAATLWRYVGKVEQAREHFDKALSILKAEPESVQLATLYAARARMAHFTEDVAKTRSWAEKALNLGKKLDAHEALAVSYEVLGLVSGGAGDTKEALEYLEKALKIALDNGYVDIALRLYNNLAVCLPSGEENERVFDCFEKGLELAMKAGHSHHISWFENMLAGAHFNMGNMDKALSLTEEADSLNRKTSNLFNLPGSIASLGFYYHVLGEWDKSEQYLKEGLSISQRTNIAQQIGLAYQNLGWCYYDRSEYAKAKEYYEKMCEVFEKWGQKVYYMFFSPYAAANHIELGEIDKASTILNETRKFAHEKQSRQLIADEEWARALLLRAEKKLDESIGLFEKSLTEYEALGARKWNVYNLAKLILYEYALTYLERNQSGDREKAHVLFNQALETFQKMGAKKDIGKVEARIAFIETGKVVSKPKPLEPVSTGYADLNKLLYGGMPPNCAVALTSPSCSERDWLVESFLEAGAKKGEVTFFVTIDPSVAKPLAEEFPSNFYLFVCNPEANAIIKSSPNVFTLKGVENLTEISIALTSAIRKLDPSLKGSRRICIGLVSDVLLQHHAVETRRWLNALMTKLKSEDFTTLAVIDPQMHPLEELHAILGLFEGEISIFEKETEKGPGKYLRVKKMGNSRYLEDELLLKKEQP
jgi:tetratricopeptide (TPR) repeat protein/KaiC/GvpD/RAD55 family RecA-like ATPase